MPKGPTSEKCPADANPCAVMVARIATGEQQDELPRIPSRRKSGMVGDTAWAEALWDERRSQIAEKDANARWR